MRYLLVVGLVGCASSASTKPATAPDGSAAFESECDGDGAKCASAAKAECPEGYATLDEGSQAGRYHLTFKCETREAYRPKPEPASTGPSTGEAILRAIGGAAGGVSKAARESNERATSCMNDNGCPSDSVCVEAGRGHGVCAKKH